MTSPEASALGQLGAAVAAASVADVVGVGIDAVDIDRFRRVLERTPRFVERVFHPDELTQCRAKANPVESFAARFAAKEAALKALGCGLWSMALGDIVVVGDDDGIPHIRTEATADAARVGAGVGRLLVSLTHTDHLAAAVVLALR